MQRSVLRSAVPPVKSWEAGLTSPVALLAMAVLAFILSVSVPAGQKPIGTGPATRRVLLVSIDGLRPDVLLRAEAPTLTGLMRRGSFTMWALTVPAAVTLPSHVSMLTGVPPGKHGIEWNKVLPLARPIYPSFPTLFEIAKRAGRATAMAAGKSKFTTLRKPETLDWSFLPAEGSLADSTVADTTVAWLRQHTPELLFLHLAGVDLAGHGSGWGSDVQLAAVTEADRCLARVLAVLAEKGDLDATVILVTSDHGGAGLTHGPDDPRSRYIPWILAGPGIRRNLDLTSVPELEIRTEDTFATLADILGLPPDDRIDGRAVTAAFETIQRLEATPEMSKSR